MSEEGVLIDLANDEALAARLIQMATGNSKDSLKALQIVLEQVDGKPPQTRTIKYAFNLEDFDASLLSEKEVEQFAYLLSKGMGERKTSNHEQ